MTHGQIQYEVLVWHALMLQCKVTKISIEHTSYILVRNFRLDLLVTVLRWAVSPQHDVILFAETEDKSNTKQTYPADSSWASN